MKKVLTILVVLALVVGAVFADPNPNSEVHKITLKSTIGEVLPVFQLTREAFTGVKTNGDAINTAEETTNTAETQIDGITENGVRYSTTAYAEYEMAELEVGDLSKNGIEVDFTVKVSNAAKSLKTFLLTFEAGDFTVSRSSVENDTKNGKQPASAHAATENTALTKAHGVTTSASGDVLTAVFNGTTLSANGTMLGTYHVEYEGDSTIDPGEYTADIVLTITVGP